LRGSLIANETNDEPKHPHVVAGIQHLHCKPIAVRDSSDQHLVWCRLHFGLVTLVASDARDGPPRHARQVFVRAAVSSLGISSRARPPLKAMVFASGEIHLICEKPSSVPTPGPGSRDDGISHLLRPAPPAAALPAPPPAKWASYRDAASRGSTARRAVKPGSPRSFSTSLDLDQWHLAWPRNIRFLLPQLHHRLDGLKHPPGYPGRGHGGVTELCAGSPKAERSVAA